MKISELNGLLKPEKEDYIPIVDNSEKETKKASMSALLDLFYPVGSYYVTSDVDFNPNESWGGTWNLDNDGTALVSQSLETGSLFNKDLGTVVGNEKFVMNLGQLPEHTALTRETKAGEWSLGTWEVHNPNENRYGANLQGYNDAPDGGDPISLIRPSKIVNRWHREA